MRTDQLPLRIALFAPNGRMGRAIADAIAADNGFALDNHHGDVLIDFSAPAALQQSLDRAVAAAIPILVGTTGLDELAEQRIAKASEKIAVLRAANTSLGVALLANFIFAGGINIRLNGNAHVALPPAQQTLETSGQMSSSESGREIP